MKCVSALLRSVVVIVLLGAASNDSHGQTAEALIRAVVANITQNDFSLFDGSQSGPLARVEQQDVARLRTLGPIEEVVGTADQVAGNTWVATGRAIHELGISDWQLAYSRQASKIVRIELKVTLPGEPIPAVPKLEYRGPTDAGGNPQDLNVCTPHPGLCRTAEKRDARVVEFLYATSREEERMAQRISFSGERGKGLSYGAARVRIPEDHRIGEIRLPSKVTFLGYELYEQKANPKRHFVIREVKELSRSDWEGLVASGSSDEAIIFIHGYNVSFAESLYRMAQIVWDLKYQGTAVLFSWASRGSVLNYVYDQQSALIASRYLQEVLRTVAAKPNIRRVHILAHSMGNFVLLEAMKGQTSAQSPALAEVIMAAPDVDRDYFALYAPELRKLAAGLTVYASSTDKAMTVSRTVAGGIPRAGDVPSAGPIVLPNMETIDVSEVGSDVLGLNHDVFASRRQVVNDISLLLSSTPRKLPHLRLAEIRGVPEGTNPPKYWRYAP